VGRNSGANLMGTPERKKEGVGKGTALSKSRAHRLTARNVKNLSLHNYYAWNHSSRNLYNLGKARKRRGGDRDPRTRGKTPARIRRA